MINGELRLTSLNHEGTKIIVVRDDLRPGGSKSRATKAYLQTLMAKKYRNVCYASPAYGYAQLALAHTIRTFGGGFTFTLASVYDNNFGFSPYTLKAAEYLGVNVQGNRAERLANNHAVYCWSLDLADAIDDMTSFAEEVSPITKSFQIPLGLDTPEFVDLLADDLKLALAKSPTLTDRRYIHAVSLGSGTFTKALVKALPSTSDIIALDVNVVQDKTKFDGVFPSNVDIVRSDVPFVQRSMYTPTFSSNPYYDSKVFEHIVTKCPPTREYVWWNIAGELPE